MKPKIIIPSNIRNKIQFIVDNCALEVSGLGTVVFDKAENAYRVTDVMLLDQEVGAAHTDIDDEAVAQACYDMRDAEGELAFWWHSHVEMATFWSGTDHKTMEAIGKNGLCVAVVFNKKEEMRGAIVMTPEGYPSYKVDDVEITIEHEYDFDTELLLKEMTEKIREKKWVHNTHYSKGETATDRVNDILSTTPAQQGRDIRKQALDEWSRLDKQARKRWIDFEDYLEEMMWGEYAMRNDQLPIGMY